MVFKICIYFALLTLAASFVLAQDDDLSVKAADQPAPANSVVRGRVFYEDTGRPVKRASLMLLTKDERAGEGSTITDSEGNFQIKNLRAGTYYPIVNAPGVVSLLAFADLSQSKQDTFDDAVQGFQPIILNGSDNVYVNIPARRGGAISGRVTYPDGDPAIGVRVEVLRKVDEEFRAVVPNFSSLVSISNGGAGVYQTDDRGYFRSAGLPAGKYIVRVTEKVIHSESSQRYSSFETNLFGVGSLVTVYYPNVFDTDKAETLDIELGQESPEISIVIPDRELYKIGGKVISGKDKIPFKNTSIVLKRLDNNTSSFFDGIRRSPLSASTDAEGNWSFEQLPKGRYEIRVEPYNSKYDPVENVYGSNVVVNSPAVKQKKEVPILYAHKTQEIVVNDKDQADLVIELSPGGTVFGKVIVEKNKDFRYHASIGLVDEKRTAAGDSAAVWSRDPAEKENYGYRDDPVKDDFELNRIPAGKLFFNIGMDDGSFYVKSISLKGVDLIANRVELGEGQILRDVQIVLATDVGGLKGKVLTDKNEPAVRAEVLLAPTDPVKRRNPMFFRSLKTNETGEFETRLAPGEYAVILVTDKSRTRSNADLQKALDELMKDAEKIRIEPGGTHKITLKKGKTTNS